MGLRLPILLVTALVVAGVPLAAPEEAAGHWEVLGEDGIIFVPDEPTLAALPPPGLGTFHDHAELTVVLQQLADAHPTLVTLASAGTSVEGRAIWRVTLRAHADDAKPWVLFDGAHHGDEVIASEVLYRYAAALVEEYPATERSRAILDHVNLVIVPMVNPDGVSVAHEAPHYAEARKNARGVDLNRNYAATWGGAGSSGSPGSATYRGPSAASEPETRAMQDLMASRNWTFYSSLHSGAEMILWPYGHVTTAPPEEALYQRLGGELSALTSAPHGQVSRILYSVSGDSMDHAYLAAGPGWKPISTSPETYEGSGDAYDWWPLFNPPDAQVPSVVARWTAFLDHLAREAAHYAPPALALPAHEGPGEAFPLGATLTTPAKRPFLSGTAALSLPTFLSATSPTSVALGALNGTRALSWTLVPSSGGEGEVALRVEAGVAGNLTARAPVVVHAPAISLALDRARVESGGNVTATVRATGPEPVLGTATLSWNGVVVDARPASTEDPAWTVTWNVADAPAGPQLVEASFAYPGGEVRASATLVVDRPELRITRQVNASVLVGEPFHMVVIARNVGTLAARGIALSELVPPGYALAPREVGVPIAPDPLVRPMPGTIAPSEEGGLELGWSVANLAPGGQFAYRLRLVPLAPGAHELAAEATYAGPSGHAYALRAVTPQDVGLPAP